MPDNDGSLEVIVESEASPGEVAAIRDAFASFGIDARVEAAYLRKSLDLLPWLVLIEVPLMQFVSGFIGEAGADAWRSLKAWTLRLFEVRNSGERPTGGIELRDPETRTTVIVSDQVSDEGFRRLARAEFDVGGYYLWDAEHGGWRKAL